MSAANPLAAPNNELLLLGSLGISAGSADAVLVKTLRTRKARMGDRSSVPPRGGMMPRKMLR